MQPTAFVEILDRSTGIERTGEDYSVQSGWHLTMHVGKPGRALVVRRIRLVRLHGPLVELVSDESGATFCECGDVSVVVIQGDSEKSQQPRPGFG